MIGRDVPVGAPLALSALLSLAVGLVLLPAPAFAATPALPVTEQARLYLQGAKGVRADLPRAFALYSRAAKEGDATAAYQLGLMYRDGMAVERDPVEGARWLQLAANAQVPSAMLALARMHLAGDGVERDDEAARHLIEKAADLDYPEAVMAMAIGLRDGSMGFERNEALAAIQLRLANRAIGQGR